MYISMHMYCITVWFQDALPFIPTKDRPVAMSNYNLILKSTSEERCVTICQTTLIRQSESVYINQVRLKFKLFSVTTDIGAKYSF